ncbi:MAG: J domain-containing protein, partial [Pseudomonadota bacterium]|nr:J domain-containing protein [Pseudomonadota bacterium]
ISVRYELAPEAHEVLGVRKNAAPSALKKRYRDLMRRYHPDRFPGRVSPEMALLLKLKSSEINEAYRRLTS